jgi:hypothetical protein
VTGDQVRAWLDQYSDDNVMGDDSNGLLVMDGFEEEAVEFHQFNQLGAWVGDHTPAFIDTPEETV